MKKVDKKEIKEIIAKVARIDISKINDDTSLRDELFIDSLQGIQIMSKIDEKYEIKIGEVEIFNVDNVNDIVELINEYKEDN